MNDGTVRLTPAATWFTPKPAGSFSRTTKRAWNGVVYIDAVEWVCGDRRFGCQLGPLRFSYQEPSVNGQ